MTQAHDIAADPFLDWSLSTRLSLPYVLPAQAQKHVTVNAALSRLDALVHLAVDDGPLDAPPEDPEEGARYLVAANAGGIWEDRGDAVAVLQDGAWVFLVPRPGWTLWSAAARDRLVYEDGAWHHGVRAAVAARSASGQATVLRVREAEHVIDPGATSRTALVIPAKTILLGISGEVLTAITGPQAFHLGLNGDVQHFGSNLAVAAGSRISAPEGTPRTYWSETSLLLTAQGSPFAGGRLRLALHTIELSMESVAGVIPA